MRNSIIFLLVLVGSISCGVLFSGKRAHFPYYQIEKGELKLLKFDSIKNCPCKLYKYADELLNNQMFGIKLSLDKVYYRLKTDSSRVYGHEYLPGRLGSLEKIVEIKVYLEHTESNEKLDLCDKLLCRETHVNNTKDYYANYPLGHALMTCHYRDTNNSFRIYNTYTLRNTQPYFSETDRGIYFSTRKDDGEYLNGWDLKSDSMMFSNHGKVFHSVEDFRNKFNANKILYSGQDHFQLVLFVDSAINITPYNKISVFIAFDDKSVIELSQKFAVLP
jgi:hypothetical protein